MKAFFNQLFKILGKLICFSLIFASVQFSRELFFRPLVVHTIGPFKMERHLYIDETFTTQDDFMIGLAAAQWEKKTDGLVTFKMHYLVNSAEFVTLEDSKAITIVKVGVNDPFTEEAENEAGNLLGLYTRRFHNELIALNVDRIDSALEMRATTMHELGHALGLDHNPRKFTLMYPSEEFGGHSITNYDLEEFCYIYFCDASKLGNK